MLNYPAGDYNFTITGTVGAKSVKESLVITLIDPCPITLLEFNNHEEESIIPIPPVRRVLQEREFSNRPAQFFDQEYVLRDP